VQDTMERRSDEQAQPTRALAQTGPGQDRERAVASVDLDDIPIYSSTGTKHIPLGSSGKYWIEIQEELDYGQQTILDNASVIGVQREQATTGEDANQTVRLDLTRQRFLLCATWIVRWNVPNDKNDKPIRWPRHVNDRVNVMKSLHPAWGDAIVAAITEHVAEKQELQQQAQEEADAEAGIDADAREVDPDDSPPSGARQNGSHGTGDMWSDGGSNGENS
jgi:hypothetical protein